MGFDLTGSSHRITRDGVEFTDADFASVNGVRPDVHLMIAEEDELLDLRDILDSALSDTHDDTPNPSEEVGLMEWKGDLDRIMDRMDEEDVDPSPQVMTTDVPPMEDTLPWNDQESDEEEYDQLVESDSDESSSDDGEWQADDASEEDDDWTEQQQEEEDAMPPPPVTSDPVAPDQRLRQWFRNNVVQLPEVARANDLPSDLWFPLHYQTDELSDTERERLINIYKNHQQLMHLGLADESDMRFLIPSTKVPTTIAKPPRASDLAKRTDRARRAWEKKEEQRRLADERQQHKTQRAHAKAAQERVRQTLREQASEMQGQLREQKKRLQQETRARVQHERAVQRQEEREERTARADREYPQLPWARSTDAPRKMLDAVVSDVPQSLWDALKDHIDALRKDALDAFGQERFANVHLQSGLGKTGQFRGYQVQLSLGTGKLTRIALVQESLLGALLAAAALLDPRLQTQRSASSWMLWIIEGGDANVFEWLVSIQDRMDVLPSTRTTGGRRPGLTQGGERARRQLLASGYAPPPPSSSYSVASSSSTAGPSMAEKAKIVATVTGVEVPEASRMLQRVEGDVERAVETLLGEDSTLDDLVAAVGS